MRKFAAVSVLIIMLLGGCPSPDPCAGKVAPAVQAGNLLEANDRDPVSLTGTATSDPGCVIESWNWDLGNGESASGQTATVTYDAPGIYVATLTVTDSCGRTASADYPVRVDHILIASDLDGEWRVTNLTDGGQTCLTISGGKIAAVDDGCLGVTEPLVSNEPISVSGRRIVTTFAVMLTSGAVVGITMDLEEQEDGSFDGEQTMSQTGLFPYTSSIVMVRR